jgi:tyrosyl-tRNA synthetase
MLSPREQLEVIKRGAEEVILEVELLRKLERSLKEGRPLRVKAGFDPTAPDIHLGHTVLLQKLRQFQDLGHEVVFLIGDFTAMIGDPSGRSQTRPPLSRQEVLENARTYQEQVFKVLEPGRTTVEFNSRWMDRMTARELVELASHWTVARMLEREDFKQRYQSENPIGIHEFLYPLIQGYDSIVLRADVELGGADQRFNLLLARELQKAYGQEPQCLVLMPLLEGLDGVRKMSKSFGNYVGITEPAEEMFGKLMSISDELMLRYYELLSGVSLQELQALREGLRAGRVHPRDAKERLAAEIVERFWGPEAARRARENFDRLFRKKEAPREVKEVKLPWPSQGTFWLPRLLKEVGLAKSTSEAQRLIRQGGVRVNGRRVQDTQEALPPGAYLLQVGKRHFLRVAAKG